MADPPIKAHSSKDNELAAELRAYLEAQGHNSIFLDFDPADGIPAGRSWEQELYTQLRSSRAVIVLCSDASMSSDWCFAEITHARSLGKHIFPLKVAPCDLRTLLTDVQVIDLTAEAEEGYERLSRGLLIAGLDPKNFFDRDGTRPPYPGLLSFQEEDAAIYFGRDQDIQHGLDLLGQMQRFGGTRLLLVLGASGSGKSSLVRAAVVPRLKRDAARWLVVEIFRPSQDPLREFAHALSRTFDRYETPRDWQALLQTLEQAEGCGEPNGQILLDLAEDLRTAAKQREACVVLVIDQLEELLGVATTDREHHFLSMLRMALELPQSPWLMIGTLRSDFLGDFQNSTALRNLAFDSLHVGPFSADHFAQVIEGPAAVAGIELESGLVQAIIEDTETPDALPLLAFTLRELRERYGDDSLLTVSEYRDQLGGLHGSVAKSAEGMMRVESLSEAALDDLRSALVSMVRINDEGQYARRLVSWDALPQSSHPILERFVAARLLVSRQAAQGRVLEVAHEALFRSWSQLAIWLDEDRDQIHLRDGIRRAAQEWDAGHRDPELLVHRGPRSEAAEALSLQPRFELDAVARDYVQACANLRQAEQDAELQRERARRRLEWAVTSLAVGMLIVSGLGIWALMLKKMADQQHHIAMRRQSAAEAVVNRHSRPMQSLLLAVEGFAPNVKTKLKWLPATAEALRTVISTVGGIPLRGHRDAISDLSFGPNGKWLATSSWDKQLRLWSLQRPHDPPQVLNGHESRVFEVAFSPDGKWLASSGRDTTVRLWDLQDLEAEPVELNGHTKDVDLLTFDPQSQQLATASKDHTMRFWNLNDLQAPPEIQEASSTVSAFEFGPKGKWLALAYDEDPTIRVRNRQDPLAPLITFNGHRKDILDMAFTPDGHHLASASIDDTMRLWDLRNPDAEPRVFTGYADRIYDIAIHPSGRWLASASRDHTARLWDLSDPDAHPTVLYGHSDRVYAIEFGPNGQWLATGSKDHTARRWAVDQPMAEPITMTYPKRINSIAFSPDGRWFAAAGNQEKLHLWNLDHPASDPRILDGQPHGVKDVALGPDGYVAALSSDQTILLWNLHCPKTDPEVIASPDWEPRTVALDPTGNWLAAGSTNGEARLWNLHHLQDAPLVLKGHQREVIDITFDASGRWLATAGRDKTARVWRVQSPHAAVHVFKDRRIARAVSFSPDGKWLLSGGRDYMLSLWDLENPDAAPVKWKGHEDVVQSVAFDPSGRLLASSGEDRTVRIWNLDFPQDDAVVIRNHQRLVSSVAFDPKGRWLASGSYDQTARLWQINYDALIALSCQTAGRNLTCEEWQHEFGTVPYRKTCPQHPSGCPSAARR